LALLENHVKAMVCGDRQPIMTKQNVIGDSQL